MEGRQPADLAAVSTPQQAADSSWQRTLASTRLAGLDPDDMALGRAMDGGRARWSSQRGGGGGRRSLVRPLSRPGAAGRDAGEIGVGGEGEGRRRRLEDAGSAAHLARALRVRVEESAVGGTLTLAGCVSRFVGEGRASSSSSSKDRPMTTGAGEEARAAAAAAPRRDTRPLQSRGRAPNRPRAAGFPVVFSPPRFTGV